MGCSTSSVGVTDSLTCLSPCGSPWSLFPLSVMVTYTRTSGSASFICWPWYSLPLLCSQDRWKNYAIKIFFLNSLSICVIASYSFIFKRSKEGILIDGILFGILTLNTLQFTIQLYCYAANLIQRNEILECMHTVWNIETGKQP